MCDWRDRSRCRRTCLRSRCTLGRRHPPGCTPRYSSRCTGHRWCRCSPRRRTPPSPRRCRRRSCRRLLPSRPRRSRCPHPSRGPESLEEASGPAFTALEPPPHPAATTKIVTTPAASDEASIFMRKPPGKRTLIPVPDSLAMVPSPPSLRAQNFKRREPHGASRQTLPPSLHPRASKIRMPVTTIEREGACPRRRDPRPNSPSAEGAGSPSPRSR